METWPSMGVFAPNTVCLVEACPGVKPKTGVCFWCEAAFLCALTSLSVESVESAPAH